MEKKIKSLEEHDYERNSFNWNINLNEPQLNGIACPDCGEELYDTDPMQVLTSNPPKKAIHCDNCGYRNYRLY